MIRLLAGDCRDVLPTLPADSVQCVVTSPPYYNLRDYQTGTWDGGDAACDHLMPIKRESDLGRDRAASDGMFHGSPVAGQKQQQFRDTCGKCGAVRIDRQIGLEASPDAYLATMVAVFREIRRVLRPDGTVWCNLGDSYAGASIKGDAPPYAWSADGGTMRGGDRNGLGAVGGYKPKDLLLMPARLALALQADGWWVRSAIVWAKPNPMPESVSDRPTSAYEMVYLLTRSSRYYYDADAVREEVTADTNRPRATYLGGTARLLLANGDCRPRASAESDRGMERPMMTSRNLRNVWTLATHAYPQAHFATYPPELAERCIRAGTRLGDTVLDPFAGAGTTLLVADRLQRDAIGIELNVQYTRMAMDRCVADAPLFTSFPPAEPPEDERMADLFAEAAE